jgi:hypothetical protein
VRALNRRGGALPALSRRALGELGRLQAGMQALALSRNTAMRLLIASRRVTTARAQREFWLEFTRRDREYRAAVRRLAQFCLEHRVPAP